MAEQFSVVFKDDRNKPAVFESSAANVVQWLIEQSNVSGYEIYSPSLRAYHAVDEFLRMMILPEFYRNLVPKYYKMNPKTEDLLPDGNHLANGMMVLTADPDDRDRVEQMDKDYLRDRILERNRWCEVSKFQLTDLGDKISFVGIYEDGSKRKRTYPYDAAWLVRIDSISKSLELATERYNTVLRLVQNAMTTAVETVLSEEPDDDKAHRAEAKAEETTKQILGIV